MSRSLRLVNTLVLFCDQRPHLFRRVGRRRVKEHEVVFDDTAGTVGSALRVVEAQGGQRWVGSFEGSFVNGQWV